MASPHTHTHTHTTWLAFESIQSNAITGLNDHAYETQRKCDYVCGRKRRPFGSHASIYMNTWLLAPLIDRFGTLMGRFKFDPFWTIISEDIWLHVLCANTTRLIGTKHKCKVSLGVLNETVPFASKIKSQYHFTYWLNQVTGHTDKNDESHAHKVCLIALKTPFTSILMLSGTMNILIGLWPQQPSISSDNLARHCLPKSLDCHLYKLTFVL